VADEVRNLALRAADAAQSTTTLIESTIQAVSNGNELTHMTRDAFAENVEIASKISELVDEISESSQEQAHGIEQVNKAITQMDEISQRNAANSEESAAAAEEMNAQAVMISRYVEALVLVSEGKSSVHARRKKVSSIDGKFKQNKVISRIEKPAMTPDQEIIRPEQIIPLDDDFKDF
jgi:methyl-accepting chemotaxis protein